MVWRSSYGSGHAPPVSNTSHGICEKQKFYEALVGVPMIIRPLRSLRDAWSCVGRRVTQNVNLIDLFATLCDAAGVPSPEPEACVNGKPLESRSFMGLMQGEDASWRNETTSEYGGTNLMIKQGDLKYQWYDRDDCRDVPAYREVLFDLAADLRERRNVAGEAAYTDAIEKFRTRRDELGFTPNH